MERFENEIKKKLSQSHSLEGVDSEALWNAIANASNQANYRRGKKGSRLAAWLFVALLSIGAAVTYVMTSEETSRAELSNDSVTTESTEVIQHKEERKAITAKDSIAREMQEPQFEQVVVEQNRCAAESKVKVQLKSTSLTDSAKRQVDVLQVEAKEATGERNTAFSKERKDELGSGKAERTELAATPINEPNSTGVSETGSNPAFVSSAQSVLPAEESPMTELTPMLQLRFLPASLLAISVKPLNLKRDANLQAHQPAQKKEITWKCYAGALFMQQRFMGASSVFVDSLNADVTPEMGYLIGGAVRMKQGKYWHLDVGLECMRWQDRFDKIILSDTMVVINQADVLAQNIRTIKHHNRADILTFPLQIGVFKDMASLRMGITVGAGYSLVLGQTGRLLKDELTVIDYSQSNKRYANFMSFRLVPSISYGLNERLMVDVLCPVSMQKHGANSLNGLSSRSILISPSVGITYHY